MNTLNRLAALAAILLVSSARAVALPPPPTASGEPADETCPAGFDAAYYAANNPDVVQYMNSNPGHFTENGNSMSARVCLHYIRWGQGEGRLPAAPATTAGNPPPASHPNQGGQCPADFDADYYAQHQLDVVQYMNEHPNDFKEGGASMAARLCQHFLRWGLNEGRAKSAADATCPNVPSVASRCGASFNSTYYLTTYTDVARVVNGISCGKRTFLDACDHYKQYGQYEGRQTSPTTTTPPPNTANNNNNNTPDPNGGALTPEQQAEQQRNQENWGDLLWTGPKPRMRAELMCNATPAQRAANPSLPPPSGFSPMAPPCRDSDVAGWAQDGGKPVDCGFGYALVKVGGTDQNPQLACVAAQYQVDRRIIEQEPQIVDFLVARGMSRAMARIFIRVYGSCGVFSTVCSVNKDGSYPNFRNTYNIPSVSVNSVNDGWFPRLNWSNMGGYGMAVGSFGQGSYTPSGSSAAAPPMCQGASTQAGSQSAYRAFGC